MPRPLQLILKAGIDMSGLNDTPKFGRCPGLAPTVPVLAQGGVQWFGMNDAALHALADKGDTNGRPFCSATCWQSWPTR